MNKRNVFLLIFLAAVIFIIGVISTNKANIKTGEKEEAGPTKL